MQVVPYKQFSVTRDWVKRALLLTSPPLMKIRACARAGAREEFIPTLMKNDQGLWIVKGGALVGGNGLAGEDGAALVECILEMIGAQVEGWQAHPRVCLRLAGYGPRANERLMVTSADWFALVDENEEAHEGDSFDAFSATALAKREGIPAAALLADGGGVKMVPFLIVANMEQAQRSVDMMRGVAERALDNSERLGDTIVQMQTQMHDMERARLNAQSEADEERRVRQVQEQDDAVKRDLVSMFGRQVGRAIDLAMLKFGGIAPDDPEMKRMFLRGFIQNNPNLIADLGSDLDAGAIEADALIPALKGWAKKNPQQAMEFGEKMLIALGELAEEAG